jgi:hypothetical protein
MFRSNRKNSAKSRSEVPKRVIAFLDISDKKCKKRWVSYVQLLKKISVYGSIYLSRHGLDVLLSAQYLPSGIAIGKRKGKT